MFFNRSIIFVLSPQNSNRSFILNDVPLITYSPNGCISSIQQIKFGGDSTQFGLVSMVGDADYYFLLPVHPKYMVVYYFRVEMMKYKLNQNKVPIVLINDQLVTKYNLLMFRNCYQKSVGCDKEFDIIEKILKP